MKKIKVLLSVIIVAVLIAVSVVSAFAMPAPEYRGDANMDRDIDITDATTIQKIVAEVIEPTKLQLELADCNGDGKVNVVDATLMQKVVAGVIERSEMGGDDFFAYILFDDFKASYDSGKAIAGEPVTFTFEVDTMATPVTYEFYIDGILIGERSESNFLTYTFDTAGKHKVWAIAYNCYDLTYEYGYYDYEVVEPYESDTPVISSFDYSCSEKYFWGGDRDCIVTVEAIKGEAPYEYKFVQYYDNSYMGSGDDKVIAYTRDFTSSNKVLLSDEMLDNYYLQEQYGYYEYVEVTVRDANGIEVTETYMLR